MAQKISQMTEQTTASMTEAGTSDFLGGYTATGGSANRKFSLSGLANYFLNKFKMTLGGSSQTVKSAIDTLNSNLANKSIDISGITTTHTIGSGSGIYRTGNVIYERLVFTLTSNVTAFETVATLPATARPIVQYLGFGLDQSNNPVPFDITYNGLIRTWKALNSGDTLNFACAYILQ